MALLILNLGICLEVKVQPLSREMQPECPRCRGKRGSQTRCERLAELITDAMWNRTRIPYS